MGKGKLMGVDLGVQQPYPSEYDAGLLQPIARDLSRSLLGDRAFFGVDIWTAYELSWLDFSGKPIVVIAEFSFPASSANIIESKSFKYYLNSFNQTRFSNLGEVKAILEQDLAMVSDGSVAVDLYTLDEFWQRRSSLGVLGECLDNLTIAEPVYRPDRSLLNLRSNDSKSARCSNIWLSHLLKTNCPVTGQPDWASIWIGVDGLALSPESVLRYIVSYREHQDFHENCVERIFSDFAAVCEPDDLWVYARYTRRGGLDINPFRSLKPMDVPRLVGVRQ